MKTLIFFIIALLIISCKKNDEPSIICQGLSIVDGQNQTLTPGKVLTKPLQVQVTDEKGTAMAGVALTWTVIGGGSLDKILTTTSVDGISQVKWTPSSSSNQSVNVKITNADPNKLNNCGWEEEFVGDLFQLNFQQPYYIPTGGTLLSFNIPFSTNQNLKDYAVEVLTDLKSYQNYTSTISQSVSSIKANVSTNELNVPFNYDFNDGTSGLYDATEDALYADFTFTVQVFEKSASGTKTGSAIISKVAPTVRAINPNPIIKITGTPTVSLLGLNSCSNKSSSFRITYPIATNMSSDLLIKGVFVDMHTSGFYSNNASITPFVSQPSQVSTQQLAQDLCSGFGTNSWVNLGVSMVVYDKNLSTGAKGSQKYLVPGVNIRINKPTGAN